MVFWGLICTSAGFLIPAFLAFRKRKVVDTVASTALAITSLLFHTTLHPTVKVVDMTLAHSIGIYSMARSTKNWWKTKGIKEAWGVIATPACAMMFYGISKGRDGLLAHCGHMGLHLTAITYWIFYIV